MAENHWLADNERPDRAMLIVVHVASTDADGTQGDANIVGSDRLFDGKSRSDILFFFENKGFHRSIFEGF